MSSPMRLCLAALATAGLLGLSGCGGNATPPAAGTTPAGPASTAPSSTPAPATPTASTPAATGLTGAAALLTAAEMPGLNDRTTWTQGHTGPADAKPAGVCQQYDLATIGATKVIARSFSADDTATAVEQLATFPDAMNTVRASKVITAWRDTCAKRTRMLPNLKVGSLTDVPVSVGKASWYLTSWVPDGTDGHFQAVGLVINGNRIALVTMDNDGQDYNYAAGKEPMAAAVKAAAAKLG